MPPATRAWRGSVAKQTGGLCGKLIKAACATPERIGPFRYRNYGNLATIGARPRRRFRLDPSWWLVAMDDLDGRPYLLLMASASDDGRATLAVGILHIQRGARLITGPPR